MTGKTSLLLSSVLSVLLMSGCIHDGPALEQEFRESGQICFSVRGKVEHRFDPLSWQSVFSPSPCRFVVCSDNMSDYYMLRCDSVPHEEGSTVTCDVEWTTYSDVKKKRKLEFKVVRADSSAGVLWLWNSSSMIGAAVFPVREL